MHLVFKLVNCDGKLRVAVGDQIIFKPVYYKETDELQSNYKLQNERYTRSCDLST